MPSRKQRRRQAKERRHEYEYVYVDEEGKELEVDAEELEERRNGKAKRPEPVARSGRTVQPPSWERVGRRALIFAPLMFVTVYLLGRDDLTTSQMIVQTFVLLAIFLPFSYFMDTITYRAYQRRANRDRGRG
jgi:hypothetical protein